MESTIEGNRPAPTLPKDLISVALIAAGFMFYTAWNQMYWWSNTEENWFGWLTPLFSVYVLYDRHSEIAMGWRNCARQHSPRAKGWVGGLANLMMIGGFLLGLMAFLVGAGYRAGVGPNLKGTFAVAIGFVGTVIGLVWIAAPQTRSPIGSSFWLDERWQVCRLLLFPTVIWLLSAPLVSVVETQLTVLLLNPIIHIVSFLFNSLGLPVGRQGNVLLMPDHGRVGVEEACSGIRSLTACLFAGSFLGAVQLRSLAHKIALVVFAASFAVVFNLARTIFLTGWAYFHGTSSIDGTVHNAAGYSVLILTIAALFGVLAFFNAHAQTHR